MAEISTGLPSPPESCNYNIYRYSNLVYIYTCGVYDIHTKEHLQAYWNYLDQTLLLHLKPAKTKLRSKTPSETFHPSHKLFRKSIRAPISVCRPHQDGVRKRPPGIQWKTIFSLGFWTWTSNCVHLYGGIFRITSSWRPVFSYKNNEITQHVQFGTAFPGNTDHLSKCRLANVSSEPLQINCPTSLPNGEFQQSLIYMVLLPI